jgi:hypothetical protein
MKHHHLEVALYCLILLSISCRPVNFRYEAQPVDIVVENNNDIIRVSGTSLFQLPDTFVWCGSPLMIDDKYYMFFSAWESGPEVPPFEDSWVLNSKIGVAVSDSPYGNFKSLKFFLEGREKTGDTTAWDARMVHNPHIRAFNGRYYLYYTGSFDPGVQPPGSSGEKLNKRNRVQQSQTIGFIEFNSVKDLLEGNFVRNSSPLLKPRTRVKADNVVDPSPEGTVPGPDNLIVTNSSVVYRPSDGKYLLFFKGNIYDPKWRGIHGVATGDSPKGPFTATEYFVFDIDDGTHKKVSAEDPFVWYHRKDKKFYAVLKDFTGKLTGGEPALAILESSDGIKWEPCPEPLFMKKELILKSGEHIKVNRLERPQLMLDKDDDPIVLFAACSVDDANPKQDGGTFNVQIPLKKTKAK